MPRRRQNNPRSPALFLEPVEPARESGLAFGVGIWVEDGIPSRHDRCACDEALIQGGGIDLTSCFAIGSQDGFHGGLVVVEDLGILDDGCDVPFDGAGEGVLPVSPEQPGGGVHEIPQMCVPVQGLVGQVTERVERLAEVVTQHLGDRLGKKGAVLEDG